MMILDPAALVPFRAAGICVGCRKPFSHREAHHCRGRGIGGSMRLDTPWNLCGICLACHNAHHAGNEPTYLHIITFVAMRLSQERGEFILPEDVEAVADLFRQMSRKDSDATNEAKIAVLGPAARPMAIDTWARYKQLRSRRR